jgi:predicted CXXCH cytochrome family protein
LNAPTKRFCFQCHEKDAFFKTQAHPPAVEDCLGCHVPHSTENRDLLTWRVSRRCRYHAPPSHGG